MSNILIINAHHKYPFAEGRLNGSLVKLANEILTAKGHTIRVVEVDQAGMLRKNWKIINGPMRCCCNPR